MTDTRKDLIGQARAVAARWTTPQNLQELLEDLAKELEAIPSPSAIDSARAEEREACAAQLKTLGYDAAAFVVRARGTPAPAETDKGWRTIESVPANELVDVWVDTGKTSFRLGYAYYDHICSEWRTSRPGNRLFCIKEKFVTHWRYLPASPSNPSEGV